MEAAQKDVFSQRFLRVEIAKVVLTDTEQSWTLITSGTFFLGFGNLSSVLGSGRKPTLVFTLPTW